jgi:hypothetical protein
VIGHLDEPDLQAIPLQRESRPKQTERPPARQLRRMTADQVLALGGQHVLDPRGLAEAGVPQQVPDVGQRVRDPVAPKRWERALRADRGHAPGAHPVERGRDQLPSGLERVHPADEPADLAGAPIPGLDLLV